MDEWKPATKDAKTALLYAAREALQRVPGTQAMKALAAGTDQSTVSRILAGDDEGRISIDRLLDVLHTLGHEIGIEITPTFQRDPNRTIHVASRLPDPQRFGLTPEELVSFGGAWGSSLLVAETEDLLSFAFAAILSKIGDDHQRHVFTIEEERPRYYLERVTQTALSEKFTFEEATRAVLGMHADLVAVKGMKTPSQMHAAMTLCGRGQKTIIACVAPSLRAACAQIADAMHGVRMNIDEVLLEFKYGIVVTRNLDDIAFKFFSYLHAEGLYAES